MGRLCTVRDVDWSGKTALVRVDFNVPMLNGQVADDTRIRAARPTLQYLREHGARVVLLSHLGRPDGKPAEKYSLRPVAARVAEVLGVPCAFAADCVGPVAEDAVSALGAGDVVLLENVRFHAEEEANDSGFAGQLAGLGDVFVNDAFGTAHRAHASTAGLAEFMSAVAGLLMEKEIVVIGSALDNPKRPFVAIVGGAKVSSKLAVLENLSARVDRLLIGGGMANTFLKAQGREVGRSLLEADLVEAAQNLLSLGDKIVLPTDVVVTTDLKSSAPPRTCLVDDVRAEEMIVDIGPASVGAFRAEIARAETVLWNGPMGVFEDPRFAAGTLAVAHAMADSGATTIVGGGESVQAVEQAGLADKLTHVSTGGGASLEFIEGKVLPGGCRVAERLLMAAGRRPIVAGNWKMNTTIAEGLALVDEMLPRLQLYSAVERVVCPPFVSLAAIAERAQGTGIGVGAQNLYPEPKGAFTGEISPGMLEGLATYVILGHSERRQYFFEDDALVNRKVRAALQMGLVPIVCVGESLEQNERGEAEAVVARQVRSALEGVEHLSAVVVAYEPIWAIGTGRAATPEGANATIAVIRRTVGEVGGQAIADGLQVQYGGSVTPENFGAFIAQPDIDGALVGGASLKADSFIEIVRLASLQA